MLVVVSRRYAIDYIDCDSYSFLDRKLYTHGIDVYVS